MTGHRWIHVSSGSAAYLVDTSSLEDSPAGSPVDLHPNIVEMVARSASGPHEAQPISDLARLGVYNITPSDQAQAGSSENPILIGDNNPNSLPKPTKRKEQHLQKVIRQLEQRLRNETKQHKTSLQRFRHEAAVNIRIQSERHEEERTELLQRLEAEMVVQADMEVEYRSAVRGKEQISSELSEAKKTNKDRLESIVFERSIRKRLNERLTKANETINHLRERQGYECLICRTNICDTVTLCGHQFCGHQFCGDCFESWRTTQRQGVGGRTCPVCRRVLGVWNATLPTAIKLHKN